MDASARGEATSDQSKHLEKNKTKFMHEIIRVRLLKFLKFIFYLIVIGMGSCWLGNVIQGVVEELYQKRLLAA